MAWLRNSDTQQRHPLASRVLVGRANRCGLILSTPMVSSEHAVIWWHDGRWHLRDLGSSNGTSVNGARLVPGQTTTLSSNTTLEFGSAENRWVLENAQAPEPLARCNGAWLLGEDGLLALPSDEDPCVTLMSDPVHGWVADGPNGTEAVEHGHTLHIEGGDYELFLPTDHQTTLRSDTEVEQPIHLQFKVSLDEEYVQLAVCQGDKTTDLGARVHHSLLLQLARQRITDHALPIDEQGWIHTQDLQRQLRLGELPLNVQIHRARKQLASAGLAVSTTIHRRAGTGQIRLGVPPERILGVEIR